MNPLMNLSIRGAMAVFLAAIAVVGGPQAATAEEYKPFDHLWMGTRDLFRGDSAVILGIGTGLTLVSFYFDERLDNAVAGKNKSLGSVGDVAVFFKRELIPSAIAAATLSYGLLSGRMHEIDAGQAHFEAIIAYSAYVSTLKFFTYRNGPGGDSLHHAFPSGQVGFVTAGSLTAFYGWQWGLPFEAIGAVGMADYVLTRTHWLSDLVFGAFLGFASGYAFAQHHLEAEKSRDSGGVTVYPIYERAETSDYVYGLGMQFRY